MPDKDGDEGKSTKSVVNKKQKQMMGEEGYDIARDMGRVRPSKDKKDATTMPPSKEMEKTRKVNKGPSALDIVKKKYKGQIMDVKKEELDLTKVAEAFGGYIVEAPKNPKPGSFEFSKELGPKGKFQTTNIVKRMMQAFPPPGTGGKVGSAADAEVEKQITAARADKKAAQMAGMDALADKITGGSKPRKTDDPKRVVQQTLPGMEGGGEKKKRSDAGKSRGRYRRKYVAAPGQLQLDFTKKADRKQIKQDIAAVAKDPVKKALVPTLRTAAKGTKATLARIVKNPIGTAIVAGVARDSFRNPLPRLQVPTVKGGKVGRRTAG